MSHPLVSIIIPVYNAENYLADCILSVLNQSWPGKEIIVVDDGSADNSLEIAERFRGQGVIVMSQENKGASSARNTGLKHAKGEYIQFLDADDLLHRDKIKNQVELLGGRGNLIGLCPTIHFYDGEKYESKAIIHEWYRSGSDDSADFLIKLYGGSLIGDGYGGAIQPNAWLTPRRIIDKAGLWNEQLSLDDDGEFFCRTVLAADAIVYSENSINYYRKFRHSGSLSAANSYKAFKSALLSTQLKKNHLLGATDDPKAKIALSRYFMEIAINTYPQFKELTNTALKEAQALGGCFFEPYSKGLKKKLSSIIGWKNVKALEHYKRKILH